MKTAKIILMTSLISFIFSPLAFSEVVKKEGKPQSAGKPGLQLKKIKTTTNYKKDGSGDWLKPNDKIRFRTTNGKNCKISVNLKKSRLKNCKVTYISCFALNNGKWSTSGIIVEALGEGSWSYDLSYDVEWR